MIHKGTVYMQLCIKTQNQMEISKLQTTSQTGEYPVYELKLNFFNNPLGHFLNITSVY